MPSLYLFVLFMVLWAIGTARAPQQGESRWIGVGLGLLPWLAVLTLGWSHYGPLISK